MIKMKMKGKKLLIIMIFAMFSISLVYAQEIESYNAKIFLKAPNLFLGPLEAQEEISLCVKNTHSSPLTEFSYPISDQIDDLKVYDKEGEEVEFKILKSGERSYVTVKFNEPIPPDETVILTYKFSCSSQLQKSGEIYIFNTKHSILANVRNYELRIILPEGYVLAELGAYPGAGQITSDGKRVILVWDIPEPYKLPEQFRKFEAVVLFKKIGGFGGLFYGLLLLGAMLFGAIFHERIRKTGNRFLSYFDIKKRIYGKIEMLKEDEQAILKIVVENDGIDQREIQRITGFSKAKVSKILSELEKRGMIRKKQVGRRNKIYLTEKVKET